MHTEERTFVAIKPDGVVRGCVGEIISRFEKKGYKLIGMKMLQGNRGDCCKALCRTYRTNRFTPVLSNILQAVRLLQWYSRVTKLFKVVRHLLGATDPCEADVGSIRADYAQLKEYNTIHGSDSVESAEREINIYFKPEELCPNYKNMMELVTEDVDER